MEYYFKKMKSPVGNLTLVSDQDQIVSIHWEGDETYQTRFHQPQKKSNLKTLLRAEQQLDEYFKGKRKNFTVKYNFLGTQFQKKVWQTLNEIPYGEVWTYSQVAQKIKNPKAVRAVGGAIGKNPISIIVPCHRVIGSNGSLTGFGGGIPNKKFLLVHEKASPKVKFG